MPERASAQPSTVFSSPVLVGIERLLGRLAGRFAGPQFGSRSLSFVDRILSRRLEAVELPMAKPRPVAAAAVQPQSWVLPLSWIPSSEVLARPAQPGAAQPLDGRRPLSGAQSPSLPASPTGRPGIASDSAASAFAAPQILALSRAFQHLRWADSQLVRTPAERLAATGLSLSDMPMLAAPSLSAAMQRQEAIRPSEQRPLSTAPKLAVPARPAPLAPFQEALAAGLVASGPEAGRGFGEGLRAGGSPADQPAWSERLDLGALAAPLLPALAAVSSASALQPQQAAWLPLAGAGPGTLATSFERFAASRQARVAAAAPAGSSASSLAAWAYAPGVSGALAAVLHREAGFPQARRQPDAAELPYLSPPSLPSPKKSAPPRLAAPLAPRPQRALPVAPALPPTAMPHGAAPWREAGGAAGLAELFAAAVALGSGAVATLAASFEAPRKEGLISQWLQPLFEAAPFRLADRAARSPGDAERRLAHQRSAGSGAWVFATALPGVTDRAGATPGAMGLRSERLAAEQAVRAAGAAQPSAADLGQWLRAPGVSLLLAQALAKDTASMPERFRQAEGRLPYLSLPAATESAQRQAGPGALTPWRLAGGGAALAELFTASIGLGSGAAGWLAESGTQRKGGLLADWLRPLFQAKAETGAGGHPGQHQPAAAAHLAYLGWTHQDELQPASPRGGPAPAKRDEGQPAPLQAQLGGLRLGRLSVQAERFAASHGLEQAAPHDGAAGRLVPVAGGLIWVPSQEEPARDAGELSQRGMRPQAATATDFPRAGAVGLRSELFAAQHAAPVQLSRALEAAPASMQAAPQRPSWSGTGGLFYLGANVFDRAEAGQGLGAAPRFSAAAAPAALGGGSAKEAVSSAGRPWEGALPVLAAEASAATTAKWAPLSSARAAASRAAGETAQDLAARYAAPMLTSFPRPSGGEETPRMLFPQSLLETSERLQRILTLLPTDWQPLAAGAAAVSTSGADGLPLWQRPAAGTRAAARVLPQTLSAGAFEEAPAGPPKDQVGRSPSLTMVDGRQTQPSLDQRAPEVQLITAALHRSGASQDQVEASVKLMQAIRSHASGQPTRTDDRLNLGDLTLIALTMGEKRMAASTHYRSKGIYSAADAMRLSGAQRSQKPEDDDTIRGQIKDMAKKVVEEVERLLCHQAMRGAR